MLGHGSIEDAELFSSHIPVKELYVSSDNEALAALPLHRGSLLDLIGPQAISVAVPTAMRSLWEGNGLAKIAQPLPGRGNFSIMGGAFSVGPGDSCHWQHLEQVPGAHLRADNIRRAVGWEAA